MSEAETAEAEARANARAAKELLNVPASASTNVSATAQQTGANASATTANVTQNRVQRGNSQQASGVNSQSATVSFFTPPANSPPAIGRKPTIKQGKLDLSQNNLKTKLFVILNEAKKGDKKSKQELKKMMTSAIHEEIIGMLVAMKRNGKVALGHSLFEYLSRYLRDEDYYNGSSVLFRRQRRRRAGSNSIRDGQKTVEEMGGTVTIEGVDDQEPIKEFYKDEANKGKLFIPPDNATMKERQVAAVLPASTRTQKFVLENSPTMFELFEFAESLDDVDEKQAIQEWALHGCQAKKGDNARRPISILAHKFELVEEPSEELQKVLKARLDQTIGKATSVVMSPPMPPTQLATDSSGGSEF